MALVSGDRPVTMGNNGGIGDSSQSTVADLSRRSSAQETGGRGTTLATAGTNTPASMLGKLFLYNTETATSLFGVVIGNK